MFYIKDVYFIRSTPTRRFRVFSKSHITENSENENRIENNLQSFAVSMSLKPIFFLSLDYIQLSQPPTIFLD